MATTGFIPFYRESDWIGVPQVIHETMKHVLYFLHSNKSNFIDTEVRLEVALSQSKAAEEKMTKASSEVLTIRDGIKNDMAEFQRLIQEKEAIFAANQKEIDEMKTKVLSHDKYSLDITRLSLSVDNIQTSIAGFQDSINLYGKTLSTVNARVRDLNDQLEHVKERERDRTIETKVYQEGLSSDMKSLRNKIDIGVNDLSSRHTSLASDVETVRNHLDEFKRVSEIKRLQLQLEVTQSAESFSRKLVADAKEELSRKIPVIPSAMDLRNFFPSEYRQESPARTDLLELPQQAERPRSAVSFTEEEIDILPPAFPIELPFLAKGEVQKMLDELKADMQKMIHNVEASLNDTDIELRQRIAILNQGFKTVASDFDSVQKNFRQLEDRFNQTESFVGDSVIQIDGLITKKFHTLENIVLQRISDLPTAKILEARLFSLETRLRLEESHRMTNEITLSHEIGDLVQTFHKKSKVPLPPVDCDSGGYSLLNPTPIISGLRPSTTTGFEDPSNLVDANTLPPMSPNMQSAKRPTSQGKGANVRRPLLVFRPPSFPNPPESPRKSPMTPRQTHS